MHGQFCNLRIGTTLQVFQTFKSNENSLNYCLSQMPCQLGEQRGLPGEAGPQLDWRMGDQGGLGEWGRWAEQGQRGSRREGEGERMRILVTCDDYPSSAEHTELDDRMENLCLAVTEQALE